MKRVMVRYKVKADKAEENKQLIRAVFEELKAKQPAGIRYATFVFPDAVSFVHIAFIETTDGSNPLTMTNAFKAFQQNIKDRCEEPPVAMDLNEVGSFNFFN
jgi:L-rhamnose mutarotase